jgi:hypothetical protein
MSLILNQPDTYECLHAGMWKDCILLEYDVENDCYLVEMSELNKWIDDYHIHIKVK